jgi:hypothetical protein
MPPASRTLAVSALTILVACGSGAVAFHGCNLIFTLVLDSIQYFFGSSNRDESIF